MRGITSLASLAFTLTTSAAFAAEGKRGMPQLDVANPLITSQVVWMAIIFFALYLLLSRWGLPKVELVLKARAATIAGDLDAARAAKVLSDAARDEMMSATQKAHAAAQAQVTAAVDQAKAEAAAQAVTANARLDRQLAEAESRIAAARASAVDALREVATTATVDVVARLAGFAPDQAVINDAVGRALTARAA